MPDTLEKIAIDIANVVVRAFRSGYYSIPHLDVYWWQTSSRWGRGECFDGGARFLATNDSDDARLVAILKRGALNHKDERSLFKWLEVPSEKQTELDDGDTALFWGHRSMKLMYNASVCCYTKKDYCELSNLTEADVSLFSLSFTLSDWGRNWIEFLKAESVRVMKSGKVFNFGDSVSHDYFNRMPLDVGENVSQE